MIQCIVLYMLVNRKKPGPVRGAVGETKVIHMKMKR